MNEKQKRLTQESIRRPVLGSNQQVPVADYQEMFDLAYALLADDEPEAVASDAMPVNRFGRITEGCAPWMNAKQEELVGHAQATQFQVFTRKNNELVGVYDSEAFRYVVDRAIELLADEPVKELKDYTLAELAELVHDMAKEKGWWDAPREWSEIACLIHSEISEAVECYRNGNMAMHLVDGKPEGLVVELADVLIRCLDYLQSLDGRLDVNFGGLTIAMAQAGSNDAPEMELYNYTMLGLLQLAHAELEDMDLVQFRRVEWCIRRVLQTALRFNLDLPASVVAKIEYNAKRPYRHGGKKA